MKPGFVLSKQHPEASDGHPSMSTGAAVMVKAMLPQQAGVFVSIPPGGWRSRNPLGVQL